MVSVLYLAARFLMNSLYDRGGGPGAASRLAASVLSPSVFSVIRRAGSDLSRTLETLDFSGNTWIVIILTNVSLPLSLDIWS